MAITPKPLGQSALSAAGVDIYTVPADTTGVIRSITICNTGGSTRLLRLYLRRSGAAAASKAIFFDFPVSPNDTIIDDAVHVLPAAGVLSASQDAGTDLTVTVDGAEVT